MRTIVLVYKRKQRNFILEDAHTHTAGIDLLCKYNIHTVQTQHDTLEFESDRDALRGYFYLSGNSLYDPVLRR